MIFGGGGFLGASIAKNLSESNLECVVVARENTDLWRIRQLRNIQVIRSKIGEQQGLIKSLKPETVVCANWIGVGKEQRSDRDIQLINKDSIIDLGRVSLETNVRKFLVLGSQAEISQSFESISDEVKPNPIDEYGIVKNTLKFELEKLFRNASSSLIWARVFSVYGEFDISKSLIPELIRHSKNKKPFQLNEPFKKWSYLYQSDFSDAIKSIILNLNKTETINVGNPEVTLVSDIANLVKEHLEEYGLYLDILSSQSMSPSISWIPDSLKLTKLGWFPKISVNYGVKRTVDAVMNRI